MSISAISASPRVSRVPRIPCPPPGMYRLPVTPPDARPLLGREVRSAVARYAAARGIRVCVVRGCAKLMGAAVAEWRGKYGRVSR